MFFIGPFKPKAFYDSRLESFTGSWVMTVLPKAFLGREFPCLWLSSLFFVVSLFLLGIVRRVRTPPLERFPVLSTL